ncbi:hypothetical protein BDW62DRAFT_6031 [Aspergillus aurantiobrunneus]
MRFHSAKILENHNWVGGGRNAYIYHVTPTIAVKTLRRDRAPEEMTRAKKQLRSKKYAKPDVKQPRGARVSVTVVSLVATNRRRQSARGRMAAPTGISMRMISTATTGIMDQKQPVWSS